MQTIDLILVCLSAYALMHAVGRALLLARVHVNGRRCLEYDLDDSLEISYALSAGGVLFVVGFLAVNGARRTFAHMRHLRHHKLVLLSLAVAFLTPVLELDEAFLSLNTYLIVFALALYDSTMESLGLYRSAKRSATAYLVIGIMSSTWLNDVVRKSRCGDTSLAGVLTIMTHTQVLLWAVRTCWTLRLVPRGNVLYDHAMHATYRTERRGTVMELVGTGDGKAGKVTASSSRAAPIDNDDDDDA